MLNLIKIGIAVLYEKVVISLCIVDTIKNLSKERGIKLKFICEKLGVKESYFGDVRQGKTRISEDRIAIIADILGTTSEYLRGETDVKERPVAESCLSPTLKQLLEMFESLSPELQKVALAQISALADVSRKER